MLYLLLVEQIQNGPVGRAALMSTSGCRLLKDQLNLRSQFQVVSHVSIETIPVFSPFVLVLVQATNFPNKHTHHSKYECT